MRNRILSMLLVLVLVCLALPFSAFAATSSKGYEEENGWMNTNPKAPTDYAYSIAVVGDTQSMVKTDLTNGTNYMSNIYSWIAANVDAKNIQYVLGVGDITEYTENFDSDFDGSWTYDDEWVHAKNAITLLDGKVPYSLCRGGGHDTTAKFNQYFASHTPFTGNVDGTYAANDYTSSYSMFEVGSVKYLLFALDWNPSDAILAWAENIIKANPDRRVIITTHAYLASDGTLHGSSASHTSLPSANNGVDIWNELVSKYDNIQLVISGHNISSNIVYRQDARESGSVVTSLLVDPQTFDSQNNAETGMVCMLYFSEDGNDMTVEWYSTVRDQYYKSANQFSLNLTEMPTEDGGIVTKYGVIPEKYTNADEYPFLTFVDGEFKDLGAYDLFSYGSGTLERALRKLTADQEVVVIARKNIDVIDGGNGYLATNYIPAKVTVDLMGHTVNANTTTPANLFSSAASQAFDTDIAVKNGSILAGKALLSVSAGGGEKTQNFTFENVNITSYYKELLTFNQYKAANNINIDFIDCNITAASDTALTNVFRSGSSGDTTPLFNSVVTVKGGSVKVTSFDSSKFVMENNGSVVKFLPNASGELTKVTVPTGASVGSKTYRGVDNTNLALIKTATTTAGDEYSFATVAEGGGIKTPYGTIPMDYASTLDYPFVAFKDGEFLDFGTGVVYDLFDSGDSFGKKIRNYTGITVILRRDYTIASGNQYKGLANHNGLFVLDLMGHTIDATAANSAGVFVNSGINNPSPDFVLQNGSIILGANHLLRLSTNTGGANKVSYCTFKDLDITTTGTKVVDYYGTTKSKHTVYLTYDNCNITGASIKLIMQAGASDANSLIENPVTVKGGTITYTTKFEEANFAKENHGNTVTFLPDDNGMYTTVIIPKTDKVTVGSTYTTGKGEMQLVNLGTKDGMSVFSLRVLDKLFTPKASLTMHSSFVYNIYIPAQDFITKITVDGVVYDVNALATKVIDDVTYLHIEKDIAVGSAADSFVLIVESDVQQQRWTLDVISYAKTIVDGSYTTTEKTLAKDILAYVRATYVYANGENTEAAVKSINAIIGADYAVDPTVGEAKASTEGLLGAGLLLGDKPAFYFQTEYDAAAYTFTVNGAKVTTEVTTVNGKTAVLVYTYAYAITETVTYTVEGTDITGEYNLAAYLAFAEGEGDALAGLVKALWQYSDAAKAYKA